MSYEEHLRKYKEAQASEDEKRKSSRDKAEEQKNEAKILITSKVNLIVVPEFHALSKAIRASGISADVHEIYAVPHLKIDLIGATVLAGARGEHKLSFIADLQTAFFAISISSPNFSGDDHLHATQLEQQHVKGNCTAFIERCFPA